MLNNASCHNYDPFTIITARTEKSNNLSRQIYVNRPMINLALHHDGGGGGNGDDETMMTMTTTTTMRPFLLLLKKHTHTHRARKTNTVHQYEIL
jgi:hypothetical protein